MEVSITKTISVGDRKPLLLIAGPCQIESRDHALKTAEKLCELVKKFPVSFVYKSSYDKANRTSISGARGIGLDAGLKILEEVQKTFSVPVITDAHTVEEATTVGSVVDIVQIPAFLCRQTDLLIAAGKTNKTIHIKKGQFLHPLDMKYAAEKIASSGNNKILLCERGATFGYRDLVVDMRGLVLMRELGYPVIFDATHSVQSMGGAGGASSGERRFVLPLARAAVAVGVDGVFIECHENPDSAPSDGKNMIALSDMERHLSEICRIRDASI